MAPRIITFLILLLLVAAVCLYAWALGDGTEREPVDPLVIDEPVMVETLIDKLITPDDDVHVGADAAYQIARRLPCWRRIAWLYKVPGIHWLTRAVYAWIAANRQSLGGKSDD